MSTLKNSSVHNRQFPQTVPPIVAGAANRETWAVGELYTMYTAPLRASLQFGRMRLTYDQARSCVADFFGDKVLVKNCLSEWDPEIGKFRTFLLTVLENYVRDQFRKDGAKKRKPPGGFVSTADPDVPEIPDNRRQPKSGPDQDWARAVIAEALRRMLDYYQTNKKVALWELFERRFLLPVLTGIDPTPYNELIARYGFKSPAQTMVALSHSKAKFAEYIREVVAEYAGDQQSVDNEIQELMAILST